MLRSERGSSLRPLSKQLPITVLRAKSHQWNAPIDTLDFARRMDEEDRFGPFRQMFSLPKKKDLPYGESHLARGQISANRLERSKRALL